MIMGVVRVLFCILRIFYIRNQLKEFDIHIYKMFSCFQFTLHIQKD